MSFVDKAALVSVKCDGELKGWGSAAQMTAQTFVTAFHVVDIREGCMLTVTHRGLEMPGIVYETDEDRDIATIYVASAMGGFTATQTRMPRLGEDIVCVGYGWVPVNRMVPALSVTKGNIAALDLAGDYVRFTAPSMPGSSGGGCWGRDGQLVLIVQAGSFPHGIPMDGMYYGRPVR